MGLPLTLHTTLPAPILLDLLLVGMDGFTVLEELRRRGVKAPVLVMSGLNNAWTATMALRMGVTDYVTKPLSSSTARITGDHGGPRDDASHHLVLATGHIPEGRGKGCSTIFIAA